MNYWEQDSHNDGSNWIPQWHYAIFDIGTCNNNYINAMILKFALGEINKSAFDLYALFLDISIRLPYLNGLGLLSKSIATHHWKLFSKTHNEISHAASRGKYANFRLRISGFGVYQILKENTDQTTISIYIYIYMYIYIYILLSNEGRIVSLDLSLTDSVRLRSNLRLKRNHQGDSEAIRRRFRGDSEVIQRRFGY